VGEAGRLVVSERPASGTGAIGAGAGAPSRPGPGLAARILLAAVDGYQWLMAGRRSPCRFIPSCSCYAAEAVERHGALRGSWLAARRLSRCRPWGGSGVDLVPD
jgi:putative membrane protein insertion efficiency factor